MNGPNHTKFDLFTAGSFGSVTCMSTFDDAGCDRHSETVHVQLQLIGSLNFGLILGAGNSIPSTSACLRSSWIVIEAVLPNTPAHHSGLIFAGDRLRAINDESTNGLTVEQAHELICSSASLKLTIEFDVYAQGMVAVKLAKRCQHLGLEFNTGNASKDDQIIVKSVERGSISHRCGAIEAGDEFLLIDDIPLQNCSVQEAIRLLQTSKEFVKVHVLKRASVAERKISSSPSASGKSSFNYTVELKPAGKPLGIILDENLRVIGLSKDGFCYRMGAISLNDRLVAINGTSLSYWTLQAAQTALSVSMESISLTLQRERQDTPPGAEDNGDPPSSKLNLIDIKRVISDMAVNSRSQALKAFESVEDVILNASRERREGTVIADSMKTRLSGSFSSSGFGSVISSQRSQPESPSIQIPTFSPLFNMPPSILSRTKSVLLFRDLEQRGFGFSITQAESGGVLVSAVKPSGVAEQNGVSPGDRILEVNNVSTSGSTCADLLPLFDSDILELILLPPCNCD